MTNNIYQLQTKFTQFGTILIVLGIIPIAGLVLGFIMGFFGLDFFGGLFLQIILDLTLIICLLVLAVNNKNIRDQMDNAEFWAYYAMIALYIYLTLAGNLIYYIGLFAPIDLTLWFYILMIYDVILVVATIFELIAWIRLSKYAKTVRNPFNINIKNGSIILAVAAGFYMILLLLDLSSRFMDSYLPEEYFNIIYIFIGIIEAIIYIVGCFKIGNNIKQAWISILTAEPNSGTINPSMYGTPINTLQLPSTPPVGNMARFCIKCGSDLIPDGEFCPRCGWKIEKSK